MIRSEGEEKCSLRIDRPLSDRGFLRSEPTPLEAL